MEINFRYMDIYNLSGYFNGIQYVQGLFTIKIENNKIMEITSQSGEIKNGEGINALGHFASLPFTDGHTHLIFAGDRSFELPLKVKGASYAEILEQGGGILTTVKHTRDASDEELLKLVLNRLDKMAEYGTTTVEAKSGYGLTADEEIRLLKILNRANEMHEVTIVPTYCGAHALPPEKPREEYVNEVISILDEIKQKKLAVSTDVFCDRGAFTVEETKKILRASVDVGLPVKVHADELEYTGIGRIAAKEFNALSADHLLQAKRNDFQVLSNSGTVAMFMPAAPIGLFMNDRPVGWKEVNDLKIGLGTDFNPNNLVISMQTAVRLAVYLYRMNPRNAMAAATTGSYLGITGQERPLLKEGSPANLILLKGNSPEEFITRFDQNRCMKTIIAGKVFSTSEWKDSF